MSSIHRRWSPEENETLRRAIWEGAPYAEIRRRLPGRPLSSIYTRVHEIRACGMHGGLVVGIS